MSFASTKAPSPRDFPWPCQIIGPFARSCIERRAQSSTVLFPRRPLRPPSRGSLGGKFLRCGRFMGMSMARIRKESPAPIFLRNSRCPQVSTASDITTCSPALPVLAILHAHTNCSRRQYSLLMPSKPPVAISTNRRHQPCPCCGGPMIIIERFQRGATPRYRPSSPTPAIRIDTSWHVHPIAKLRLPVTLSLLPLDTPPRAQISRALQITD